MKKVTGIILIVFAAFNIIVFIYLSSVNPDKLSKNSSYFGGKTMTSLILGGVEIYLLASESKNESKKDNQ